MCALSDPERMNKKLISVFQGIVCLRQSSLSGTVGVQWRVCSHLRSGMFSERILLLSPHQISVIPSSNVKKKNAYIHPPECGLTSGFGSSSKFLEIALCFVWCDKCSVYHIWLQLLFSVVIVFEFACLHMCISAGVNRFVCKRKITTFFVNSVSSFLFSFCFQIIL